MMVDGDFSAKRFKNKPMDSYTSVDPGGAGFAAAVSMEISRRLQACVECQERGKVKGDYCLSCYNKLVNGPTVLHGSSGPPRNKPCPCGSRVKYKKCCFQKRKNMVSQIMEQMRSPQPEAVLHPAIEGALGLAQEEKQNDSE